MHDDRIEIKKDRRGDFFRIKFLDAELMHKIMKSSDIGEDELILGKTYSAILEGYATSDNKPWFWDLTILGELASIIEVRIIDSDLASEKVWLKCVGAEGGPMTFDRITAIKTADDAGKLSITEVNELIRSIETAQPNYHYAYTLLKRRQEDLATEMLMPLIGRYFKFKTAIPDGTGHHPYIPTVFRVVSVPKPCSRGINQTYDPRRIPVYKVESPGGDFDHTARDGYVYSDAYCKGLDKFFEEYTEITEEEFNEIILKRIKRDSNFLIPDFYADKLGLDMREGDDDEEFT